ncbi:MAG TPA: DnaB-like helicase C-terminal domain-containing protein [Terriglobia bacterium]|nr:DnaB-like helicase C-terminal domain-containing protein [Terriglobia bacterium]
MCPLRPQRGGGGATWVARCPAHADRTPSLTITATTDRILLKCFAGCSTDSILAKIGLKLSDLFLSNNWNSLGGAEAVYPYLDETGALLFEVLRFPGKKFLQRRPGMPETGLEWVFHLKCDRDCKCKVKFPKPARRVLYRLPDLLAPEAGASAANPIIFVEGEKDVATARELGFVATCNPHGAGKWANDYAAALAGKHVVILADADKPGLEHANTVARALVNQCSVKLTSLPNAKDLTAWVENRGQGSGARGQEELKAFIAKTPLLKAADLAPAAPAPGTKQAAPLSDLDSERALLGSILLDNSALNSAIDLITASDFHSAGHRSVFESILALSSTREAYDVLTVAEYLTRSGELATAGGSAYVHALSSAPGPGAAPQMVREYAAIIREKAHLRKLGELGRLIESEVATGSHRAHEIAAQAVSRILDTEAGIEASKPSASFRASAQSLLGMLETRNLLRVETGIKTVDAVAGGFLAGELVIIAAESGAGKTLLASQTRRHSCSSGHHGLHASAEMSKEQLLARELATRANVERYKMRFPERLTDSDFRALMSAASEQCSKCEILEGEITMARVSASAKRMKRAGNLSFVIVDYDELVWSPGKDELERQSAVASACKSLANSMAVPVILVSQLRKLQPGESRRASNNDRLHGSAAKKKHATTIIFIWRKFLETFEREDEATARITVTKNRNGDYGARPVYFDKATLSFRDLTEEEEAALRPAKGTGKGKGGRPAKPADPEPESASLLYQEDSNV